MAAKTYSQETLETFHNVRIGGPKEKRLRKVELMGEHSPKSIFYVKVLQKEGDAHISTETFMDEFNGIGPVGDVYRPITEKQSYVQDFAFVGFYSENHCNIAIRNYKGQQIEGKEVTVSVAPSWLLELYPTRAPGHMHESMKKPASLSI
jgi:RNA recognition motif-containing protein